MITSFIRTVSLDWNFSDKNGFWPLLIWSHAYCLVWQFNCPVKHVHQWRSQSFFYVGGVLDLQMGGLVYVQRIFFQYIYPITSGSGLSGGVTTTPIFCLCKVAWMQNGAIFDKSSYWSHCLEFSLLSNIVTVAWHPSKAETNRHSRGPWKLWDSYKWRH